MYMYNNEPSEEIKPVLDDIHLEIAEVELLRAKILAFHEATQVNNGGTRAMSETVAKREILGMSDDEIFGDLQNQFVEAKIRAEIENASYLLPTSGLFDQLVNEAMETDSHSDGEEETESELKVLRDAMCILRMDMQEVISTVIKALNESTEAMYNNEKFIKSLRLRAFEVA